LEALEVLDLGDFEKAIDDATSLVACACCGELKKKSEIARAEEAAVLRELFCCAPPGHTHQGAAHDHRRRPVARVQLLLG